MTNVLIFGYTIFFQHRHIQVYCIPAFPSFHPSNFLFLAEERRLELGRVRAHAQQAPSPFIPHAPWPAVNCLNDPSSLSPTPTKQQKRQREIQIHPPASSSPLLLGFLSHHPPDPVDLGGRPREATQGRPSGRRRRRKVRREKTESGRRCSCGTGSTGCSPRWGCGRRRPRSSSSASTTPARPRCFTCSRMRGWCSTSRRSTRRRRSSASARSSSRPSTSAVTRSRAASGRITTQRLML